MRIGVNVRLLLQGKLEGIGHFSEQLLKRMVQNHPDDEFVFFFDRKYAKEFVFAKNVKPVVLPVQARHPVLWQIYFDWLLPFYCKKYKIDVFFSPENYLPKLSSVPMVCTIHDLNFMHNTSYIGNKGHQKYFMKYFPLNAKKCARIVTVSEFSKQDIAQSMQVEQSKIDVVYNAANECYKPLAEEVREQIKQQYTSGKDYFYFVGALHKRKNLEGMFRAFDIFKQESKSEVKLLIIGNKKWWDKDIELAFNQMHHKNDVIFLGRLEKEKVAQIAGASLGLLFVSLFEGFGIPIVEAFQSGTAVITSNLTSMPEVASDAALVVNPYDDRQVAEAMLLIYSDSDKRQQLIEKGFERNKLFSWDKSSEKLWKILQQCTK